MLMKKTYRSVMVILFLVSMILPAKLFAVSNTIPVAIDMQETHRSQEFEPLMFYPNFIDPDAGQPFATIIVSNTFNGAVTLAPDGLGMIYTPDSESG